MSQEERWLRRCREGDGEAFARIYESYVRAVYDFAYFKTFHRETAEDITGTTFMKAFEHIGDYDPEKGAFAAWLFTIARNEIIGFFRKRKPVLSIEDVWDLSAGDDVEMDAVNREYYLSLIEYLNKLPAAKRDVLILRIWQDLPFKKIAAILDLNESQCKMTFYRVIEQMRKEVPVTFFILLAVARHVIR